MKLFLSIAVSLLFFVLHISLAEGLDPLEIIKKVDSNYVIDTAKIQAEMIIQSGGRTLTKSMTILSEGGEKGLIEFTNPQDRGTKYLKLGDELWMFFPEAEDIVKISGHMLRQGIMGSDYSYEDALEYERLGELYNISLLGKDDIRGKNCYLLELTAKPDVEVAYFRRRMWVTEEEFVIWQEELYAPSGKLLKLYTTQKIGNFDGRFYPVESTMENKLRKDSRTVLRIDSVEFGVPIPPGTFSKRALR
ncbi:MAG: outer membrane lipoprotein-sorting protein [bacterium]